MVRIITDSSALYTPAEAKEKGFTVVPLVVQINGQSYRDLEISAKDFMEIINQGHVPTSSQPPIGEVIKAYEEANGEEVLNICMADGLSGTYRSAETAKDSVENNENIHVLNTTSLCGPQRYMIEKALEYANEGLDAKTIISKLQESIESSISFLIPVDFNFLKRGGRLTGMAATVGGMLKLKPVMYTVEHGTRIDKYNLARTMNSAIDSVIKYAKTHDMNEGYRLYISDADNQKASDLAKERFANALPNIEIVCLKLGAAFITQGGPGAVALQFVKK